MQIKDLFTFDRWLTPFLAKIIYYIGIVVSVIGGLSSIVGGLAMMGNQFGGVGAGLVGIFGGLAIIVGGIVTARVIAELTLIVFRIHEELRHSNARR